MPRILSLSLDAIGQKQFRGFRLSYASEISFVTFSGKAIFDLEERLFSRNFSIDVAERSRKWWCLPQTDVSSSNITEIILALKWLFYARTSHRKVFDARCRNAYRIEASLSGHVCDISNHIAAGARERRGIRFIAH